MSHSILAQQVLVVIFKLRLADEIIKYLRLRLNLPLFWIALNHVFPISQSIFVMQDWCAQISTVLVWKVIHKSLKRQNLKFFFRTILLKLRTKNLQMSLSMNAHKALIVHARLVLANEVTPTKMIIKIKYHQRTKILPNKPKIANLAQIARIRTQHVNLIIQTKHPLHILKRSIATSYLHNVMVSKLVVALKCTILIHFWKKNQNNTIQNNTRLSPIKEKQKCVNFLWINAKELLKELVSGPIVLRRKLVNFFPPSA